MGCFHILGTVNNYAINMYAYLFVEYEFSVLLCVYLEVELLDQVVILCLAFLFVCLAF